jgi:hypothetical protein
MIEDPHIHNSKKVIITSMLGLIIIPLTFLSRPELRCSVLILLYLGKDYLKNIESLIEFHIYIYIYKFKVEA